MSDKSSPATSLESVSSNGSNGSVANRFTKIVTELGKRLAKRQERDSLVGKNILKDEAVSPTIMQTKMALEKERQHNALNRKLQLRPEKMDLKLRNILKDSSDSLFKPDLEFEEKQSKLKSILKKRPTRDELQDMNIIKNSGLAPPIVEAQRRLSRSMIEDTLAAKLRNRPDIEELEAKNLYFCETVEVHTTFRKSEYNRKPDGDVTFKHLTPQLKMQIRNELNTFKKTEMEIHAEATQNTQFHY